MHEVDLATELARLAEESAVAAGASRVLAVHLALGRLSGVDGAALHAAFREASAGTLLDGSRLLIREVPVVVWCAHCLREVEIGDVRAFRCPTCGTAAGELRAGKELEIESLEIESREVDAMESTS